MLYLFDDNQADVTEAFSSTLREDRLNSDNPVRTPVGRASVSKMYGPDLKLTI